MENNKIENIDFILKQAWTSVLKMYSEKALKYDSTAVQALVLLKIDPKKGTRSTNIGPKMAIEPTSLTRILKVLFDNGFIRKEKIDTDKRAVIIKLTEKGMKFRNISREVVLNFNKDITEKISPEKIEIFKEVMDEITKTANEVYEKMRYK
ncbi:MAG: MarR family transcriptional regulator [Flavobacteriaceae bacterium]|jgi:DNA-binding MarR family transcriptional regulator|nr:MarR family transcriptional regulator [Flavobacteriaceae bacterium]